MSSIVPSHTPSIPNTPPLPPTHSLVVFVKFIENELTLEFHAKLTRFYNQQPQLQPQPPPQQPPTSADKHHHNTALSAYLRIVQLIRFVHTDTLHQEMEELRDSLLAFITENAGGENTNLEGTTCITNEDTSKETMVVVSR